TAAPAPRRFAPTQSRDDHAVVLPDRPSESRRSAVARKAGTDGAADRGRRGAARHAARMNRRADNEHCPSSRARRRVLATGAGLAVSLVVRPAYAEDLAAAVASFTGGAPVRPGKVKLDIPALVENGNTVPVTVSVDSPMTAADRVAT